MTDEIQLMTPEEMAKLPKPRLSMSAWMALADPMSGRYRCPMCGRFAKEEEVGSLGGTILLRIARAADDAAMDMSVQRDQAQKSLERIRTAATADSLRLTQERDEYWHLLTLARERETVVERERDEARAIIEQNHWIGKAKTGYDVALESAEQRSTCCNDLIVPDDENESWHCYRCGSDQDEPREADDA